MTVMKKALITLLCFVPIAFFTSPAQAGKIKPHPVTCWFFRGENLEIKNTCTEEGWSWAGGGFTNLVWEDGVKNKIQWGLQGRGSRDCPENETAIDSVCGKNYARDPKTMQSVSKQEGDRLRLAGGAINCVQVKQNSVCWRF